MYRTVPLLFIQLAMLTILVGCRPFNWRTLKTRNTTALRLVTDSLGNQVILARGEIDGSYGPERGVLISSGEKGTGVFGAWELRPDAEPGGGWSSLRTRSALWLFDATRDSVSGKMLIVTLDAQPNVISVYRELEYQHSSGLRFQAFENVASLRTPTLTSGSIVIRSDTAGVTELFHGTPTGVYYTSANIEATNFTNFQKLAVLAENPTGFVFASVRIAVGGDSSHREVLAIGKADTGKLAILKSRRIAEGKWTAWAGYQIAAQEVDIGTPVGLTAADGKAIFAVPHRSATIIMSGILMTTVPGPSKYLSAALDSKGRIVLASCDSFGVYSNEELSPQTSKFLGWRTLKSEGYWCDPLDGFIHLNRNKEGRLLLVQGSYSDNILYLWQATPAGDWERVE